MIVEEVRFYSHIAGCCSHLGIWWYNIESVVVCTKNTSWSVIPQLYYIINKLCVYTLIHVVESPDMLTTYYCRLYTDISLPKSLGSGNILCTCSRMILTSGFCFNKIPVDVATHNTWWYIIPRVCRIVIMLSVYNIIVVVWDPLFVDHIRRLWQHKTIEM